jgi:DNA-directed RNA polymerase subunit RPC12/RpoP
MILTRKSLAILLAALSKTNDDEVDCEYCQNFLAAVAESKISETCFDDPELLPIERHLDVCADCSEELELLIQSILIALKAA